jgi:hypothetical protein
VITASAFVWTPQFLGYLDAPVFFVYNVRYAAPPLALGLVLVPLLPLARRAAGGKIWLGGASLLLLATELDPGVWPSGLGGNPLAPPIHGDSALAGAAIAAVALVMSAGAAPLVRRARGRVGARSFAMAAALAASIAGGWIVAHTYGQRRYLDTAPIPQVYRWARSVRHSRIAVVGLTAQYPLYGTDSSNYVQYVGSREPRGGFGAITSCRAWRAAVDHGHYDWLLVAPYGFPLTDRSPAELGWTAASPAAIPVLREIAPGHPRTDAATLFRITGFLDPATCR